MISIAQQIDEVQRELAQRATVYPRLIASRQLRESLARFQTERLEAALRTLQWVEAHQDIIRKALDK